MTPKRFALHVLTLLGLLLSALGPAMIAMPRSVQAAPTQQSGEDFTIIVLPDTQFYSESYPATFQAPTTPKPSRWTGTRPSRLPSPLVESSYRS